MTLSPETYISNEEEKDRFKEIGEKDPAMTLYPLNTPVGEAWVGLYKKVVVWLSFGTLDEAAVNDYWHGPVETGKQSPVSIAQIVESVKGNGGLELAPIGTPFQQKVWKRLLDIPVSTTTTYGEIAASLGSPNKARAVGTAVAANPIAWLIPCHRVVPMSGGIGSYRWGKTVKGDLLVWEKSHSTQPDKNEADTRRKLESMLIKTQRFEDIARMSGDIAHDLNNLLAPIRMATQLLKRNLNDSSVDRYVEIIETSTGRARGVIQEILSFSRETENTQLEQMDIIPLLDELKAMAIETFPDTIDFSFEYEANIPEVSMDPGQFHRAILNLLVNARDAMDGKGRVSLKVFTHDFDVEISIGKKDLHPGKFVCISVADNGCGIADDIRERIFDPFFTTKSKEEGTGLGLSSVYGIIARAGGFIDLDSEIGKGTTFHIYLPPAKPDA